VKFSSGVTLKELISIAEIAAALAKIGGPSREAKRNFRLMVCWFKTHWSRLTPWLNLIHLRDRDMNIIDSGREVTETGKYTFPLAV
jgi:hypothetical protein